MQGAQVLRNEAYLEVRRNDEGGGAIPRNAGLMDFLRSRQFCKSCQRKRERNHESGPFKRTLKPGQEWKGVC